jgi:hypothetical protein
MPGGLRDKSMFWLPTQPTLESVRPLAICMPQFSSRRFVESVEPAIAFERLAAINRLTLELNDYYWYTAALDLLWPQPGNGQRQLDTLRVLTASTPCFTFGIDRSAGTDAVVTQVLDCLKRARACRDAAAVVHGLLGNEECDCHGKTGS